MKKSFLLSLAVVLVLTLPAAGLAQGRSATLYGYEKAEFVTGVVSISADGGLVMVRDLFSKYSEPVELYLSKGFDINKGILVGQIAAGTSGNMSFDARGGDMGEVDTVLLIVPGWTVPVGVGLLK